MKKNCAKKTEISPHFTIEEAKLRYENKGVVVSERKAGWYPDGPGRERYFDGTNWTEHTSGSTPDEFDSTEGETGEDVGAPETPANIIEPGINQITTSELKEDDRSDERESGWASPVRQERLTNYTPPPPPPPPNITSSAATSPPKATVPPVKKRKSKLIYILLGIFSVFVVAPFILFAVSALILFGLAKGPVDQGNKYLGLIAEQKFEEAARLRCQAQNLSETGWVDDSEEIDLYFDLIQSGWNGTYDLYSYSTSGSRADFPENPDSVIGQKLVSGTAGVEPIIITFGEKCISQVLYIPSIGQFDN